MPFFSKKLIRRIFFFFSVLFLSLYLIILYSLCLSLSLSFYISPLLFVKKRFIIIIAILFKPGAVFNLNWFIL